MPKTHPGLDDVRELAKHLRSDERTTTRTRKKRDRAIIEAAKRVDPDGDRPRPLFTNEEIAKAAGISEHSVRKIRGVAK